MKNLKFSFAFCQSILICILPDGSDIIKILKDKSNNRYFGYNITIKNNKINAYKIIL